ncbi:MAG: hypothetical protein ACK4NQ_04285 [Fimbriimonadaceae bacterium]
MSKFFTLPVVGFHGPERAGKDTAAAVFVSRGWHHVKFADPLYEEVYNLHPRLMEVADADKDKPLPWAGGLSKRDLLISHGQARRSRDPDYWVRKWVRTVRARIQEGYPVVCSDVRMRNEAEAIFGLDGVVIGIRRPGVDFRGGATSTDHTKEWASAVVVNDGPIEGFQSKMAVMVRHIEALNREMRFA